MDLVRSPLMPSRHADDMRSQRYSTGVPQRRPDGSWPTGLRRMRQAIVGFVGARSITDLMRTASKRQLTIAAGAVFIAAAAWFSWYWITIGRHIESTDDAYIGGEVIPLSFKVAGLIEMVAIADHQTVKAGDLLLKLDGRDYRAQLARTEANVASRKAALANADATRRMRVSMLELARAELAAALAERVRAKYDTDRYRTLSSDRVAPKQQPDADNEKARVERKAQAALEAAEHQLDMVDAQREQAAADLDQVLADRDLARLNLGYTEIRSPIDGIVGNRSARVGAYATVGAQVLAIVPARGLWVDANFKESQLARMRKGQPAEIVADAVPGVTFRGHVASLSPATGAQFSVIPPENATGNFTKIVQRVPVRIQLDDAANLGRLRPGLSVTVRVNERQSTGTPVDERQDTPARDDGRPDAPVRDARR